MQEFLAKLMRGRDGLHVVGGAGYGVWFSAMHRITGMLPEGLVHAIVARLDAPRPYTLVLNGHVLGGAYEDRTPSATAFPHRGGGAWFVLDETLALPNTQLASTPPEVLEAAAGEGAQFLRCV